jgi:hypothetical protein
VEIKGPRCVQIGLMASAAGSRGAERFSTMRPGTRPQSWVHAGMCRAHPRQGVETWR